MDQRFEGMPKAEIRLEGRKLFRGPVTNDWGSQLVWEIRRDGTVITSASARADFSFDLAGQSPGNYEAVLQMYQYEGYEKDAAGNFTKSKFVDVSNKLAFALT